MNYRRKIGATGQKRGMKGKKGTNRAGARGGKMMNKLYEQKKP